MATAVTPAGVRDGDPAALAGLCDRRGPAVLAYCGVVAGHGETAAMAAADAFGSFRAAVVAASDLGDLNPEALLISATRHAAARYAASQAAPSCGRVPQLLAARADRSITLADNDWLVEHLATCWTCRAPVARFESADRAYRDPPSQPLVPELTAAIVAAMTAAAPVAGAEPPVSFDDAHAASANGNTPQAAHDAPAEPQPGAGDPASAGYVEQPTAMWQIGVDDADLVGGPQADDHEPQDEQESEPSGRRGLFGAGLTRRPRSERPPRAARKARSAPEPQPEPEPRAEREPRATGGTQLPRPRRDAAIAAEGEARERRSLRPGVVLPIVLVVLAIIVALLVAGVFGGGDPASAPQSFAPDSGTPTDTAPADVVVVPGAKHATAADVERAKARARAAKRGAEQPAPPTSTTTSAAVSPTAASPTAGPTPVATPPPPPPPSSNGDSAAKQTKTGGSDSSSGTVSKINAGDGASGAQQPPAAADTSTVPDLAPPAVPPG